jgi:hypothetical protein
MKNIAKIFFYLGLLLANLILVNNSKTRDRSNGEEVPAKKSIQTRELTKNYDNQTKDQTHY